MLFCTGEYVLFLAAVVTLYWLTPWPRARVWILLVASYAFYASWNRWLALLVAGSSLADYLIARGMDASPRQGVRKLLLVTSLRSEERRVGKGGRSGRAAGRCQKEK